MEGHDSGESRNGRKILELFWRYKCAKPLFTQRDGLPMSAFFMMQRIALCTCRQRENGEEDGVRISEISRCTRMSMPAVSQMLNSLEAKGLVMRSMTKHDRRAVFVCLMPKGKALLEQAQQELFAIMAEVERRMGQQKVDQLMELSACLFDIMEDLKEERDEAGKEEPCS